MEDNIMAVIEILGIQVIGLLFGLIMLYVSFQQYRKNTYTYKALILWLVVWALFILFVLFPDNLYTFRNYIGIRRTLDFFVIGGVLFFSVIVFYLFMVAKRTERRMETLVSKLAAEQAEKIKKK